MLAPAWSVKPLIASGNLTIAVDLACNLGDWLYEDTAAADQDWTQMVELLERDQP